MTKMIEVIETFPFVRIPSSFGGLPIEVSLIAQLGYGAGDHLFSSVSLRQKHHTSFINELDEPSAKLGGMNLAQGDATSLYSFSVGANGHPFHRHAGHRIFTAISGSGGAQLRFSTASDQQIADDPQSFIRALRHINIPPDCLFTVRFGGNTWHQFSPLKRNSLHSVLFALSCHTNELGGNLTTSVREKVLEGEASIPTLTELLPENVTELLRSQDFLTKSIPTTTLSLDAPAGTFHRLTCDVVRGCAGFLRGAWSACRDASGYLSHGKSQYVVEEFKIPIEQSLLHRQLTDVPIHHDDTFCFSLNEQDLTQIKASQFLALILEGFLSSSPRGVSTLMSLRNLLVKPFGLRTSPLGCPVSSLLSDKVGSLFANQYPVLDQYINELDTRAEVILGANDKHLKFRSCVGVEIVSGTYMRIWLGSRVHCKNWFGRVYMAAIDWTHRHYIAPTMLRYAVEYAVTCSVYRN